jgi:hypothetical protein
MISLKVKKINSGNEIPAEVRSITDGLLTVLIKDFETATLFAKQFQKSEGTTWISEGGEYSCEITDEMFNGGEILVRVPKK